MANVPHATLTGSELHEPKGADTAGLGTVYVADGAGSGSWASIGTSAFTGMIADFAAPVPPAGWLELDGSVISTSTYSGLFAVMSIPTTGTRTNGSPIITSIPSTTNMRVGYYVFGTGIGTGLTILSVDSPSQITLSGNASSSGTAAIDVSPWLMGTGTVKLPDLTTAGYYRRSRTASTKVGDTLADQNKAHTHGVSGNTGTESASHTHTYSGTTGNNNANHSHTYNQTNTSAVGATGGGGAHSISLSTPTFSNSTGIESATHGHAYSGTTAVGSATHTHAVSLTSASDGGTEARPLTIVILTCIKT